MCVLKLSGRLELRRKTKRKQNKNNADSNMHQNMFSNRKKTRTLLYKEKKIYKVKIVLSILLP